MLGKLIKYELKATRKFMLLLYGMLLAMSVIMIFIMRLNKGGGYSFGSDNFVFDIISALLIIFYVVLITTVLVAMFFYAISRFRTNLLGDEGYLMHTLPVTPSAHIWSKTIVSCMWTILSILAVAVSCIIIALGITGMEFFDAVYKLFSYGINQSLLVSPRFYVNVLWFVLAAIVQLVSGYLKIYASMSVGFSFNKGRTALSLAAYALLTVADNIVTALFMNIIFRQTFDIAHISPYLIYELIITALMGAAYYFIAVYFLKHRLNLQ